MQLAEQIELFSIPVEMYAGGKQQPIRKSLADKVRSRLDYHEPDFAEEERRYEAAATKEAQKALDAGDFERGERILSEYATQAQERAKAKGLKSVDQARLEGDTASLRQAVAQGIL